MREIEPSNIVVFSLALSCCVPCDGIKGAEAPAEIQEESHREVADVFVNMKVQEAAEDFIREHYVGPNLRLSGSRVVDGRAENLFQYFQTVRKSPVVFFAGRDIFSGELFPAEQVTHAVIVYAAAGIHKPDGSSSPTRIIVLMDMETVLAAATE